VFDESAAIGGSKQRFDEHLPPGPAAGETAVRISGVGAGLIYRSPSDKFKCVLGYAYGVDAIRAGSRGGSSVSILIQVDLGMIHKGGFTTTQPGHWNGWNWLLGR